VALPCSKELVLSRSPIIDALRPHLSPEKLERRHLYFAQYARQKGLQSVARKVFDLHFAVLEDAGAKIKSGEWREALEILQNDSHLREAGISVLSVERRDQVVIGDNILKLGAADFADAVFHAKGRAVFKGRIAENGKFEGLIIVPDYFVLSAGKELTTRTSIWDSRFDQNANIKIARQIHLLTFLEESAHALQRISIISGYGNMIKISQSFPLLEKVSELHNKLNAIRDEHLADAIEYEMEADVYALMLEFVGHENILPQWNILSIYPTRAFVDESIGHKWTDDQWQQVKASLGEG
jgi:hypothetical protein